MQVPTPLHLKSSTQDIKNRFNNDVERFSNLETGQQTTIDAAYNLDLITEGIVQCHPQLSEVLDLGCGAGNFSLKLALQQPGFNSTLVDLSEPMLLKAKERMTGVLNGNITTIQSDIRALDLPGNYFDTIIATAVLHHLRDDEDWQMVFSKIHRWLKPGGSVWIFDLITHDNPQLNHFLYNNKYGNYLSALKDDHYKNAVFEYIDKEDSPRSLSFQTSLLKQVGFSSVEILHKHLCFASFVGFK
ncbi:class I SAM-dependent methyltransferase [Polluticaenibacter yanchengensis]|uniref:Class I SAM-dependent methyltransferase n=1 Tax=Polluticaenibacter yanchengensis TaxID=3014562 RepID=A0ABT4UNP7_9BACT|nr:class I SAM-dependent methyltransferase [Chitinophagaceae bacterium LY-5]